MEVEVIEVGRGRVGGLVVDVVGGVGFYEGGGIGVVGVGDGLEAEGGGGSRRILRRKAKLCGRGFGPLACRRGTTRASGFRPLRRRGWGR